MQTIVSMSVQVGICIDNDARKMSNDYDVHVQPLMDLSNLANAKLGFPPKRWSLASLTEMVTCREVIFMVSSIVLFAQFW